MKTDIFMCVECKQVKDAKYKSYPVASDELNSKGCCIQCEERMEYERDMAAIESEVTT